MKPETQTEKKEAMDFEFWKLWGLTDEEIDRIGSGDLTIEDTEAYEAYDDDLADCFQED